MHFQWVMVQRRRSKIWADDILRVNQEPDRPLISYMDEYIPYILIILQNMAESSRQNIQSFVCCFVLRPESIFISQITGELFSVLPQAQAYLIISYSIYSLIESDGCSFWYIYITRGMWADNRFMRCFVKDLPEEASWNKAVETLSLVAGCSRCKTLPSSYQWFCILSPSAFLMTQKSVMNHASVTLKWHEWKPVNGKGPLKQCFFFPPWSPACLPVASWCFVSWCGFILLVSSCSPPMTHSGWDLW